MASITSICPIRPTSALPPSTGERTCGLVRSVPKPTSSLRSNHLLISLFHRHIVRTVHFIPFLFPGIFTSQPLLVFRKAFVGRGSFHVVRFCRFGAAVTALTKFSRGARTGSFLICQTYGYPKKIGIIISKNVDGSLAKANEFRSPFGSQNTKPIYRPELSAIPERLPFSDRI